MSSTWTPPVAILCHDVSPGWAGVWTLTHAAAHAAQHLADALPLVDALDVLYAGAALRVAQDHLEHVAPDLPGRCAAVDIGPLPARGVSLLEGRLIVGELITTALTHVRSLEALDLSLTEALAAAEVEVALVSALARVTEPAHEPRDIP